MRVDARRHHPCDFACRLKVGFARALHPNAASNASRNSPLVTIRLGRQYATGLEHLVRSRSSRRMAANTLAPCASKRYLRSATTMGMMGRSSAKTDGHSWPG